MEILSNYKGLHKELKDINILAKKTTSIDYVLDITGGVIKLFLLECDHASYFIEIELTKGKWKALESLNLNGTFLINPTSLTKILNEVTTTELLVRVIDGVGIGLLGPLTFQGYEIPLTTMDDLIKPLTVVSKVYENEPTITNIDCSIIGEVIKSKTLVYFPFKIGNLSILLSKNIVPYPMDDAKGEIYSFGNYHTLVIKITTSKYIGTQYIRFIPF